MKNLVLICLTLILLTSCGINNLAVDYDYGYNFSNVKTYNYYNDNNIQMNQIDSVNLMRTMDQVLQSKGLVKNLENPDIMVAIQVYNREGSRTNTIGVGVGGGGRGFGLGTSIGIPISSKINEYYFQIDFDDAQTRNLIWTGKNSNTLSYNANTSSKNTFYKNNIQAILKRYPPSKANQKTNYYN